MPRKNKGISFSLDDILYVRYSNESEGALYKVTHSSEDFTLLSKLGGGSFLGLPFMRKATKEELSKYHLDKL